MNRLNFTAIHAQDAAGRAIEVETLTDDLVRKSVFRILDGCELCSIATIASEGTPHINTAYFSHSTSLDLYFLSHPDSQHCQNLSRRPASAMSIYSSAQQWNEPGLGIQLVGACEKATGPAALEAEHSYATRFPAYANWKAALKKNDLARQYRFYRFGATALKILDERSFGDAVFILASVARC